MWYFKFIIDEISYNVISSLFVITIFYVNTINISELNWPSHKLIVYMVSALQFPFNNRIHIALFTRICIINRLLLME